MRIVADTNTVVSGLLWQGLPRRLLDLARQRTFTPCTSVTLLAELAEVLGRDKFAQRIRAAGLFAAELVRDYERLTEIVEPQLLREPASRDPDDDHVLACAVAAGAEFIVSGDRDLLHLGTFNNIRIVNTTSALQLLGSP